MQSEIPAANGRPRNKNIATEIARSEVPIQMIHRGNPNSQPYIVGKTNGAKRSKSNVGNFARRVAIVAVPATGRSTLSARKTVPNVPKLFPTRRGLAIPMAVQEIDQM